MMIRELKISAAARLPNVKGAIRNTQNVARRIIGLAGKFTEVQISVLAMDTWS